MTTVDVLRNLRSAEASAQHGAVVRRDAALQEGTGAMPEQDTQEEQDNGQQPSATDDNAEELGENGVKALRAEREARKQLEAKLKELEPAAKRLQELEDEQKSEQEKLTEKLSATEKRAAEAELRAARLEVATDKGLPLSSVKFLTGETQEELSASADELIALMGTNEQEPAAPSRRPQERLRPGASPDAEPEQSPKEIAASLFKQH